MSHVRVETAGHVVEITDDTADHKDLAAAALDLWRATRFRRGPYASTGGSYEQADPAGTDHDGTVGFRPAGEVPDA